MERVAKNSADTATTTMTAGVHDAIGTRRNTDLTTTVDRIGVAEAHTTAVTTKTSPGPHNVAHETTIAAEDVTVSTASSMDRTMDPEELPTMHTTASASLSHCEGLAQQIHISTRGSVR